MSEGNVYIIAIINIYKFCNDPPFKVELLSVQTTCDDEHTRRRKKETHRKEREENEIRSKFRIITISLLVGQRLLHHFTFVYSSLLEHNK